MNWIKERFLGIYTDKGEALFLLLALIYSLFSIVITVVNFKIVMDVNSLNY